MLIDPPRDSWYPKKERRKRARVARTAGTALMLVSTSRKRDAATVHALQAYLGTRPGPRVRKTLDLDL